ncbi:UDP-4-amino-4,6-dideoxy-N-acetyl-beta-L-altrosamine N-acetyltransferase [Castellaniella sp.]|uniref:UDP-4-amino-4, 6-dideoxy-N-acetyl-beta-L-altrosamine N-acetyltransferase n=1 Tax=Castellaniella sp. TaxID=1955812 RepID=UPI003C76259E
MSLFPLNGDDLDMVLLWRNQASVRKNMYTAHSISIEEHREWFEKIKDRQDSKWLIYKEKNGIAAGVVYFTNISAITKNAFWGFYAGADAMRGVGSRMELEALDYAFQVLGLHKLNCEIFSSNSNVIRLHEKFGFSIEGRFRDFHFDGMDYIDIVRMGILEHEWNGKRSEMISRLARYL